MVNQLVQAHAYWHLKGLVVVSCNLERRPCRLQAAITGTNNEADSRRYRSE